MAAVLMTLDAFLAGAAARPWTWGRCDCCLMVADWLVACGLRDPAADLRTRYADESGAVRAIEAEGGLVALFERRLTRIGLERATMARPGHVGVVTLRAGPPFGAIATSSGWAVKTSRGVVVSRVLDPVACWSFADG